MPLRQISFYFSSVLKSICNSFVRGCCFFRVRLPLVRPKVQRQNVGLENSGRVSSAPDNFRVSSLSTHSFSNTSYETPCNRVVSIERVLLTRTTTTRSREKENSLHFFLATSSFVVTDHIYHLVSIHFILRVILAANEPSKFMYRISRLRQS